MQCDGSVRSVSFFVSRLEYSRYTTASLVPDQTLETCVRTLIGHDGRLSSHRLTEGVRLGDDGIPVYDAGQAGLADA